MNVPNVRIESGLELRVRLKDNGVSLDWSSLQGVKALLYSVEQKAVAGAAEVAIDKEDSKILIVKYPGSSPQYMGLAKLIIRCEYNGKQKTYDIAVANFVETTDEATGVLVLDDPTVSVTLSVEEVSTSLLDEAINEAFAAAELARTEAANASDIGEALSTELDAAKATNAEVNANEQVRETAEAKRESNEAARIASENARMSAEESRQAAEIARESAESRREQAENERQANESERESAEIVRQKSEDERQVNEEQRISTFNTFKTIIDSKQDAIADLDAIRSGSQSGKEAAKALATLIVQSLGEQSDKAISQKAISSIVNRLYRLLGYNDASRSVTLEQDVAGKYVKCATRSAVENSKFAISKPFEVDACSELLIKTGYNPSDESHSALDISVIAIYEEIERQRTIQKKDASGNLLYYATTTDAETGSVTVTTDETTADTGYPVYVQETYTETRYLPNNEDRFVAIPDSGYYVANIPQSCKVVVSYKPGVTDTTIIVEKHGALASLISQVFGIYEHRTMVEAMVSLAARVDALESRRGLLGNATAGTLDVAELTKCLYPTVLRGHGVPAASNIPDNLPEGLPWDGVPVFVGQLYINLDATSGGLYYAIGHDSVANWKQA